MGIAWKGRVQCASFFCFSVSISWLQICWLKSLLPLNFVAEKVMHYDCYMVLEEWDDSTPEASQRSWKRAREYLLGRWLYTSSLFGFIVVQCFCRSGLLYIILTLAHQINGASEVLRTSSQSHRLVRRKDTAWSLNWSSGANLIVICGCGSSTLFLCLCDYRLRVDMWAEGFAGSFRSLEVLSYTLRIPVVGDACFLFRLRYLAKSQSLQINRYGLVVIHHAAVLCRR